MMVLSLRVMVKPLKFSIISFSQFSLASVVMLASCLTYHLLKKLKLLTSLNPNKAPGPDNLHSQILKNCAESLAYKSLLLLFNQSINTSMLPSDWRRAHS